MKQIQKQLEDIKSTEENIKVTQKDFQLFQKHVIEMIKQRFNSKEFKLYIIPTTIDKQMLILKKLSDLKHILDDQNRLDEEECYLYSIEKPCDKDIPQLFQRNQDLYTDQIELSEKLKKLGFKSYQKAEKYVKMVQHFKERSYIKDFSEYDNYEECYSQYKRNLNYDNNVRCYSFMKYLNSIITEAEKYIKMDQNSKEIPYIIDFYDHDNEEICQSMFIRNLNPIISEEYISNMLKDVYDGIIIKKIKIKEQLFEEQKKIVHVNFTIPG